MKALCTRLSLLTAAVLLSACSAYQAQRQAEPAPAAPTASATAPVAPRATTNQDMVDDFARESEGEKQAILLSQLEVYKQELAAQGKYDCCVKPGCNECVLQRGECQCRIGVEKGGPCCGECTAAWIEGRGDVAGLDKEEVLRNLGCYRELYEGGPQGDDESAAPVHDHDQADPAPDTHKH